MSRGWLLPALASVATTVGLLWLFSTGPLNSADAVALSYQKYALRLEMPRALGLLALTPLLLPSLVNSLAGLPWQQRSLSLLTRLLFALALALALSQPSVEEQANPVSAVVLVDLSDSVGAAGVTESAAFLQQLHSLQRTQDSIKVVVFGKEAQLLPAAEFPPSETQLEQRRAVIGKQTTDMQAAFQLAQGLVSPNSLQRVLLLGDGLETRGALLPEVQQGQARGLAVHARQVGSGPPQEVAIRALEAPDRLKVGEPFKLNAELFSTADTTARLRLFQGAVLNGLDGVRTVELHAGSNTVSFQSVSHLGGKLDYRLVVDELAADAFKENNEFKTQVDVPGRPRILVVDDNPADSKYLASALSAQQFDVDVRAPGGMPTTLQELEPFALIVLNGLPSSSVPPSIQDLTRQYVQRLGGGLLFAGGANSLGPGGWAQSSLAEALPVRLDGQRQQDVPSVAMTLVIDRSGSMTGLPLEMAKAACSATVGTLKGEDLLSIIAFDGSPKRYVRMQPARYQTRIQNEISRIQPGGSTAIFRALDAAYQDIAAVEARKKHVILLTDGRSDDRGIQDLVQTMLSDSITVTAVGLGSEVDATLLRTVAEYGGGRFHQVSDPNRLPRIFTRETQMISRQATTQDWFPAVQQRRAGFLKGIQLSSAPLLRGYVPTAMKPSPAELVLSTDNGDPLLARWRYGLGYVLTWTSDLKGGWASNWLRWRGFGQFLGQLSREHMKQHRSRDLALSATVRGDRGRVAVEVFTEDERFDNDLKGQLFVTQAASPPSTRELVMTQSAPGRYEASFDLEGTGVFKLKSQLWRIGAEGQQISVGEGRAQIARPYPTEYATVNPDAALLNAVARAGGGRFNPSAQEFLSPGSESVTRLRSRSSWLIRAALLLLLVDVLVRRVRLFDRHFRRS